MDLIDDGGTLDHRGSAVFGQVPIRRDDDDEIFVSDAIVLRSAGPTLGQSMRLAQRSRRVGLAAANRTPT